MHVHPPKPLHGWKEFLNEIFVIVIGVLIALGFEQVVEELHWQHKVHDGEERLDNELKAVYRAAILQVVVAPCVNRQFDALEERVLKSGATLDPATAIPLSDRMTWTGAAQPVILTRHRLMPTGVWATLNADGTILHMPLRQQRRLGLIYNFAQTYGEAATHLDGLSDLSRPVPLDPAVRYLMMERIQATRNAHFAMTNAAVQIAANLKEMGLAPGVPQTEADLGQDIAPSLSACKRAGYPLADWQAALAKQMSLKQVGL
ncbi:MAG: hypothetical protein WCL10_07510 [Novosphingobium sp.]|uniref:hypothetical protein n=1 Tax=Novosphingobium sp. TaxID=1874826 RepID=UPI00301B185D